MTRAKRIVWVVVKSLGLVTTVVVISGMLYEEMGRRRERDRLSQIGHSVDIGGRTLNIYCSGEGAPPVVLKSPGAGPGYVWSHIQPEIAKFTQACWYDRAGEGWSDPGPFPRTSAAIASDLHLLLRNAGVQRPFVLVGASFGGLNARVYNGLYPNDVAGMVLVDAAHEDEPKRAPPFFLGHTAPRYMWYPLHLLFQITGRIGVVRSMQPQLPRVEDASRLARDQLLRALKTQVKSVVAGNSTGVVYPDNYAQVRSAGDLDDRPLIVLTAGKPFPFRDPEMARQAAAYQEVWKYEMQPQLARLSSRGRQIIVEESGHAIADQAPDVVIAAIREIVSEVRGQPEKPM